MSRSIPAGGQITPFDWASLSLSGRELPPPTVGGSPLTSGGHVAPCSGDVLSAGCASTTLPCAKPTNAAMITMVRRKSQLLTHLRSVFVNAREAQNVPHACRRGWAFDVVSAKSGCRLGGRGDSIGTNRTNGDRWNRAMGGSIQAHVPIQIAAE